MSLVNAMNVCDCWFVGPRDLISDFPVARTEYRPLACSWRSR